MDKATIYCKQLGKFKTIREFIEAFYSQNIRNATYYIESGEWQCNANAGRSLDDLLELCKYHVEKEVTMESLIRSLDSIARKGLKRINTNPIVHSIDNIEWDYKVYFVHGGIYYCPDIYKVVFVHNWKSKEQIEKDGTILDLGDFYGTDSMYYDRKGDGSISLREVEEILKEKPVEVPVKDKIVITKQDVSQNQGIMGQTESFNINSYSTGANPGRRFASWYIK